MSIESYIKNEVKGLCDKVYIAPEIVEKKLNNAITGMTDGVNPDYVLAVADTTVFGSSKEGLLFTGDTLYIHALVRAKIKIPLKEILSVSFKIKSKTNKKGKVIETEHVLIQLRDESTFDLSEDLEGINKKNLTKMLDEITKLAEVSEFTTSNQTIPLSMMPEEIKMIYMELICNFALKNNEDNKHGNIYAEIISLAVRIKLSSGNRVYLRAYLTNQVESKTNFDMLNTLSEKLDESAFKTVKKSLIKDILNLNRQNENKDWRENTIVIDFIELINVEEREVDVIEKAIKNDEEILQLRKNDNEITESMKDLAAKASAIGLPLTAIYLSGSVMGVSAAGITSGLASLGMGGLLGFSSMFSGIGVAILIGVGTYQGVRKLTGISDVENNKQRELMLQEIIRNSQVSLNYLIEDVNEISQQLVVEIQNGIQTKGKIDELSNILQILSSSASGVSNKINYAEREEIITRLPMTIDRVRLKELTNKPTRQKYKDIVMECYIEQNVEKEDGQVKTEYRLVENLSIDELNNLENIFTEIGYNTLSGATVSSVKGATQSLISNFKRND